MDETIFAHNIHKTKDFLGNELSFDCMGCAIVNEEIAVPGGPVYRGKFCFLAPDPEIPIPGFLVLNARRHVNSFAELTLDERHEIGDVLARAETALKQLGITKEITLVQEERSTHFHIWIFPVQPWMVEKFGAGISTLREVAAYAKTHATVNDKQEVLDVAAHIREKLANSLSL